MQEITIAIVQSNQFWEDIPANLAHYEKLLCNVEADLILLPEMFQTGFSMNTKLAENWENSSSISWLKELSRVKNSAFYTSLMINEKGIFFNRGVFISPNGNVKKYDKRKVFGLAREDKYYKPGNEEVIVEYLGWHFQLQICYDLRFPEIVRNSISPNLKTKYDVILYVANWPEKRALHWNSLLQARAIENQCYVVACNRVGKDKKELSYNGCSKAITPLGEIVNQNCEGTEKVIYATLNKNEITDCLKSLPFLKDC